MCGVSQRNGVFVMRGSANRKGTLPIISFHGVVRPYQPPPLPVTQTLFFLLCIYWSRDFTPPQAIVASLYSNHFFTLIFVAVIRVQSKHAAKLNPFLEEKKSNVKNGMQKKNVWFCLCVWGGAFGASARPHLAYSEIYSTQRLTHFHITKSNGHRSPSASNSFSRNDGNHSLQINGNFLFYHWFQKVNLFLFTVFNTAAFVELKCHTGTHTETYSLVTTTSMR